MAKKFFYVCAGLFLLALSYHLGARSAGAQAGSQIAGVAAVGSTIVVVTSTGDTYQRDANIGSTGANSRFNSPLTPIGNYWDGPTPAQSTSWGQVKSTYRK